MSGTAIRLGKECRALGAVWLAGLGTVLLARAADAPFSFAVAAMVAVVLGVWSFGHEFTYRTLPLLLVQPVSRRRQAFEKLGVLALMAGALAAAAFTAERTAVTALLIGTGASLTVAPALTLLAGNARAGLIFTMAALLLWYAGTAALAHYLSRGRPDLVPDQEAFLAVSRQWSACFLLVCTGAVAWRRFMTLEAVPETTRHVGLFSTSNGRARQDDASRPARGHFPAVPHLRRPALALLGKEVALQQSLFAITALAGVLWLVDWRFNDPLAHQAMTMAITLMHGAFVTLLAGAIASAEERRLGTGEWNVLQPVSSTKQWTVKSGAAIGLAMFLALGLPQVMAAIDPDAFSNRDLNFVLEWRWAFLVVGLACGSLYVSSLAQNALLALLVAMPANFLIWSSFDYATRILTGTRVLRAVRASDVYPWFLALVLVMFVGYLLLLLLFAGLNHRTSGPIRSRVATQGAVLLVYLLLAAVTIRQALHFAIG